MSSLTLSFASAILGVGFLVAAVDAEAQIVKKGDGYLFRAKYTKGRQQVFDFQTIVVPTGPQNKSAPKQNISMPLSMLVTSLSKAGIATIRSEVGPIKVDGKTLQPKSAMTVQVDNLNRLVGVGAKELPQFATPLPEKPIKIGGSWSSNVDASEAAGERVRVKAIYKLLRVVGRVAYIQVQLDSVNAPGSTVKSSGRGQMVLRTADGSLESMEMMQTVDLSRNRGGARTTILVRRKA